MMVQSIELSPGAHSTFLPACALCRTNTCFCIHKRIGVGFNPDQPAAQTNNAHGPALECIVSEQNGLLCVLVLTSALKNTTNVEVNVALVFSIPQQEDFLKPCNHPTSVRTLALHWIILLTYWQVAVSWFYLYLVSIENWIHHFVRSQLLTIYSWAIYRIVLHGVGEGSQSSCLEIQIAFPNKFYIWSRIWSSVQNLWGSGLC